MIDMIFKKLIFIMLMLTLFFSNTSFASNIVNGKKIYQQHCVMCHGVNGKSVMAGAADFNRGEGLFQSDHGLLEYNPGKTPARPIEEFSQNRKFLMLSLISGH